MWRVWIPLLISLCSTSAFEYNVTILPETLPRIRTGASSSISITITPISNTPKNGSVPLSIQCLDEQPCHISDAPTKFDRGVDGSRTCNVTIHAIFVGITHLNVTVDGEQHIDYKIRILRSDWEHIKAKIFMGTLIVFIPIVTFLMGTQLEWRKIRLIWQRPVGPIASMLCQFGIMPIIAYLLARFVIPEKDTAVKLALFAAGTCPGGGKSSFWTIIYGGNLDLSISLTFAQNLAALVMMPLWIGTLGREFSTAEVHIPYMDIVRGLLALMIPTIAGMIFINFKRHLYDSIQKWIKIIVWIATFIFFAASIYANMYIVWLVNWQIVLCGCLLPWSGYIIALIVGTVFRMNYADKITISIETGIQHVGIAMVILMWTLPEPEVDLAIVILFVAMLMTDKPLLLLYGILKCYWKATGKEKKKAEKERPSDIEKPSKQIDDEITVTSIEPEEKEKNSS